ncbi:unnamed protein product [Ectocarpus fasciculatus]
MSDSCSSSYWLDHCSEAQQQTRTTAALPAAASVVVIGAGITGASAAYHLGRHGIDSVLLDRGSICGGATGRNGGFLAPGIADSVAHSVETFGADTTRRLYQYTEHCTDLIEAFVSEHGVDCELRFGGEAILAVTAEEAAALQSTHGALVETCGADVEWWDRETCRERTKSNSYQGGIFKKHCGNLWPVKLVVAIVQQAVLRGANMQSHTAVLSVRRNESMDSCIVETDRGEIVCDHVVHATNAWASELIPGLADVITPVRNQVIMTAPAPRMWDFGLCANQGYEYFMQRPDGRLLLGGMRNLSETAEWNCKDEAQTSANSNVSSALRSYFQTHFEELAAVETEHEWIGVLGFSRDRNPLIGPMRSRPGEFIAAGFSGHGMPYTFLAGKNVADMIHGQEPTPYILEAFTPDRFEI